LSEKTIDSRSFTSSEATKNQIKVSQKNQKETKGENYPFLPLFKDNNKQNDNLFAICSFFPLPASRMNILRLARRQMTMRKKSFFSCFSSFSCCFSERKLLPRAGKEMKIYFPVRRSFRVHNSSQKGSREVRER
jgi:hypothetical protein